MLAIESKEVSLFYADMGTDLLKYMGELISQLLKKVCLHEHGAWR
jgi:uncharacterized protein YigA (DUF484 family)